MFTLAPTANNASFAFLPSTLTLMDADYNSYDSDPVKTGEPHGGSNGFYWYAIAAYWHKINKRAGTHTAAYGELVFRFEEQKLVEFGVDPAAAPYEAILELNPDWPSMPCFSKMAYSEMSLTKSLWLKPRKQRGTRKLLEAKYDAQEHVNMLHAPNDLPRHSDGWYNFTSKKG